MSLLDNSLPDSAKVAAVSEQKAFTRKYEIRVDPNNGTTFTSGKSISFILPRENVCQLKQARFVFNAIVNGVGRFENNIENIIDTITLSTPSSSEIVTVTRARVLNNIWNYACTSNDQVNYTLAALMGVGDSATRDTWGATNRRYLLTPLTPFFFDSMEWLPMFAINEPVTVTFTLSNYLEVCEVATATGYTVSNPQLVIDYYQPTPSYMSYLQQVVSQGSYQVKMTDIEHVEATTSVSNNSIPVSIQRSSLTGFYAVMRTLANLQALGTNDKNQDFNYNSCNSFQLSFNSGAQRVPSDPLDTTANAPEAYLSLYRTANASDEDIYQGDIGRITPAEFISDKFVMALELRSYPVSLMGDEFLSGYSSSQQVNNIRFNLQLASSPAAQQVDMYFVSDAILQITPSGKLQKLTNF